MQKTGRKPKARDEELYKRHIRHLEKEMILDHIRESFSKADESFLMRTDYCLTLRIHDSIEELRDHCRKYNV